VRAIADEADWRGTKTKICPSIVSFADLRLSSVDAVSGWLNSAVNLSLWSGGQAYLSNGARPHGCSDCGHCPLNRARPFTPDREIGARLSVHAAHLEAPQTIADFRFSSKH
jgi:hypothetical protein